MIHYYWMIFNLNWFAKHQLDSTSIHRSGIWVPPKLVSFHLYRVIFHFHDCGRKGNDVCICIGTSACIENVQLGESFGFVESDFYGFYHGKITTKPPFGEYFWNFSKHLKQIQDHSDPIP